MGTDPDNQRIFSIPMVGVGWKALLFVESQKGRKAWAMQSAGFSQCTMNLGPVRGSSVFLIDKKGK